MERFVTDSGAESADQQPQTTPAHSKPAATAPPDRGARSDDSPEQASSNNSEDQVDYALQVYLVQLRYISQPYTGGNAKSVAKQFFCKANYYFLTFQLEKGITIKSGILSMF